MANLFSDGFEGGNLSAWSASSTDGGNLSAATAAALHGAYGLSALINDANNIYVRDDTPANETHYRCRFYFDPNSITQTDGSYVVLCTVTNTAWDTWPFSVYLYKDSGNSTILCANPDFSAWIQTGAITDAPHCVEVEWQAGVANGILRMWVDGALIWSYTSLAANFTIDYAFLGATFITGTNSGTIYLDDFASNNDGGPLASRVFLNIGDSWKVANKAQINIGDSWKTVTGIQINIGDAWKTVF